MGTRGLYGFRKNKIDKVTYNHSDSYPEWLGEEVVKFIRETTVEEMREIVDKIVLVDDTMMPTDEELVYFKLTGKWNGDVNKFDWYTYLRDYQGNLSTYKDNLKYMSDDIDFIKHSLHCEWAYIINLDEMVLEVYKGFQNKPNNTRYYKEPYVAHSGDKYYPCDLIATYPLNDIPTDWVNQLGSDVA